MKKVCIVFFVLFCSLVFVTADVSSYLSLSCTESEIDCSGHGVCYENTQCICDEGYYTQFVDKQCAVFKLKDFSHQISTIDDNFNCTSSHIDCNNHGNCNIYRNKCICYDSYTTFNNKDVQCNYKKKSQLIALLLSIFVGLTGAAWFYLGYIVYGLLQLLGVFVMCILACMCGFCCCAYYKLQEWSDNEAHGLSDDGIYSMLMTCGNIIGLLLGIAYILVFYIVTIVIMAYGDIDDANNIGMAKIFHR